MTLKIIGSKKEYQQYLDWADEMFDKKVTPESPEGEQLQVQAPHAGTCQVVSP